MEIIEAGGTVHIVADLPTGTALSVSCVQDWQVFFSFK